MGIFQTKVITRIELKMGPQKFKTILPIVAICIGCILYYFYSKNEKTTIMGPRWLLYSDEKLLETFEDEALNGKERALQANIILYERLYLSQGKFTQAKPFLMEAADLGDKTAKEILNSPDPEKYYRDFKKRIGESIPDDFKLK